MTPDQAWTEFVGDQSRNAFLYLKPINQSLEEYVAAYVAGIPDSVSDIPSEDYWETVGSDPATVTNLLVAHIKEQSV